METENVYLKPITLKNIMKFTYYCNVFIYGILHNGRRLICLQSDRNKRLIRNQFICAYHFLSHSHLYHAGNRRKRCHHEKSR